MISTAALLAVLAAGQAGAMGGSTPPPGPVVLPQAGSGAETEAPPPAPPAAGEPLTILDAAETDPESLLLKLRPVIVFADTPEDAAFATQIALLSRDPAALAARDAVVIVDSDPSAQTVWRQRLRPRGFSLVVLDKQGMVIERRPTPWDAREIGRAIDKTPERRSEARSRNTR